MFKSKIQEALQNTDLSVSSENNNLVNKVFIEMPAASILCACYFDKDRRSNKMKITIDPWCSKLRSRSFEISNGFDSNEFLETFSKRISTVYEKTKKEKVRVENEIKQANNIIEERAKRIKPFIENNENWTFNKNSNVLKFNGSVVDHSFVENELKIVFKSGYKFKMFMTITEFENQYK